MALTKIGRLLDKGVIKDQTNLGAESADTDEYLLYDASADALKSIASSNVVGPGLITGKSALGEGAATGDLLLIYDTSAGVLKKVTQNNLLNFPQITSVSPTNVVSGDGTGNHTFTIAGTGFTGASANLINSSGSAVAFSSVTVDSATQITGVIAKSNLPDSGEPYDVKVTAATGLASTLDNQINVDAQPIFSTAAGSLGTVAHGARSGLSFTVAAADPESGGDVVYTLESGSIPAGLSFSSTSSGAVISGNADAVGSNTTSTFTIRAKDVNSNTSDRQFTITVNAPQSTSYTSSGTFTVPSGLTTVDVLVVAGGGSGGNDSGGGGGAGGLIYRPAFPVTPGGTVTVTVGSGGSTGHNNGQDSVFGTLTAKGGGHGGTYPRASQPNGNPGGSGGGGAGTGGNDTTGPSGSALQPNQSGESGNYGFGTIGGYGRHNPGYWVWGGGGGGAGSQGHNISANPDGTIPMDEVGYGGTGKAYTIGDGTTSVYYAGGGGGGGGPFPNLATTPSFPSRTKIPGGGPGNTPSAGGGFGGVSGSPDGTYTRDGTANRGGGGGGGSHGGTMTPGGAGGKGIVIVRY